MMTMSRYTMQLRTLIEQASQNNDGLSSAERIEIGRKKLFDFDYPIFDEAYRKVFETKFIRKFYMREIGFETEGLFKFQLETWLLINMPYFNKLYESELIEFNPLENSSVDVTHNKKTDVTQNDEANGTQSGNETVDSSYKDNLKTDKTGNSVSNRSMDSTTNIDSTDTSTTENSDQRTGNETNTDKVINTTDSTTTDSTNETSSGTKENDDFERKLVSNTPDSRLNITTNDGEGVITYASSINEENENNVETTNNQTDTNKTSTTNSDSTTDTTGERNSTQSGTSDSTTNSSGSTDTVSSTDSTDTTNVTENETGLNTGDRNSEKVNQLNSNNTLNSNINNVEDFIQHRAGKIGIQTYSEMVMKFRSSFIRIDNDIHDEMSQLFMLVY